MQRAQRCRSCRVLDIIDAGSLMGGVRSMPVMFADYGPGTLTGTYVIMFGGLGVAGCLLFAGLAAWFKEKRIARRSMIAAGGVLGLSAVIVCICIVFGKTFHLL
jgi:hypothetical protein